jgi:hypothetical protein
MQRLVKEFSLCGLPSTMAMATATRFCKAKEDHGEIGFESRKIEMQRGSKEGSKSTETFTVYPCTPVMNSSSTTLEKGWDLRHCSGGIGEGYGEGMAYRGRLEGQPRFLY